MRRVGLGFLQGDELLARAIFDEEGRVLLREGVVLKRAFIKKLQDLGIRYVYINDEVSQGIEVNDVVSEETRQKCKKEIAITMQQFIRTGNVSLQGTINSAQKIIQDLLSQKDVMVNLVDIRSQEDMLFSHSVNVCILAVMTGVNMGYNMANLKELAMGALFHDLGLIEIMKETIPGTGKMEVDKGRYQEHSKLGYNRLNKQEISSFTKVIALTHHEQCDGTGFPFGLKFTEIHEMVRIVSICNAFDNIVHGIRNQYDVPAYHAIEFLEASPHLFDATIVQKFVVNVSMYPSGSRVRLSSGEKGIVIIQNKGFSTRPVIRILGDGEKIDIDLSKKLTIFIEEVYEN